MNEVVQPTAIPSVLIPSVAVAKQNLLDLDREGLERFFAETLGEARYRATR